MTLKPRMAATAMAVTALFCAVFAAAVAVAAGGGGSTDAATRATAKFHALAVAKVRPTAC